MELPKHIAEGFSREIQRIILENTPLDAMYVLNQQVGRNFEIALTTMKEAHLLNGDLEVDKDRVQKVMNHSFQYSEIANEFMQAHEAVKREFEYELLANYELKNELRDEKFKPFEMDKLESLKDFLSHANTQGHQFDNRDFSGITVNPDEKAIRFDNLNTLQTWYDMGIIRGIGNVDFLQDGDREFAELKIENDPQVKWCMNMSGALNGIDKKSPDFGMDL